MTRYMPHLLEETALGTCDQHEPFLGDVGVERSTKRAILATNNLVCLLVVLPLPTGKGTTAPEIIPSAKPKGDGKKGTAEHLS